MNEEKLTAEAIVDNEVNQPVPIDKPLATIKEEHTPETTTFHYETDPVNFITKFFSEEEEAKKLAEGHLTYFLGNTKASITDSNELIQRWIEYREAETDYKEGEISESSFNATVSNWKEFATKKFPDKSNEEILDYSRKLYTFYDDMLDKVRVRSQVIREPKISNMNKRGSENFLTGDVVPRKAVRNNATDLVERMRRQNTSASDEPYQFDILLRNSFVGLTLRKPSKTRLGDLLNAVYQSVKGFVRSTNNPTINLSYLAAVKALWDYVSSLIVNTSVKDVVDFKNLEDIILITDVEPLAIGLATAMFSKGYNVQLYCLQKDCNWTGVGLADPAKLLHKRDGLITPEEAAVYANIQNHRRKYSVSEIRELQKNSKYNEDNLVYNKERNYAFEISPPTLRVGFEALQQVSNTIVPRINKLRSEIHDQEAFETNLNQMFIDILPYEYIHWVSGTITFGEVGEDDLTIKRNEEDQTKFNEGLMVVIEDDTHLGRELISKVANRSPFMSRTFTGVGYYECPHCKKSSKETDSKGLGYTPINALMNFFTLTQLMQVQTRQELLSMEEEETF